MVIRLKGNITNILFKQRKVTSRERERERMSQSVGKRERDRERERESQSTCRKNKLSILLSGRFLIVSQMCENMFIFCDLATFNLASANSFSLSSLKFVQS